MTERRIIELHIVMDESGAFVVADNPNEAADRAEEEFGEDADVRQVSLTIELLPPSKKAEPVKAACQID